jgi:hypothetical protein
MKEEQHQELIDVRPFQLFVPVPPMLAEAIGYSGTSFGQPLDARYVAFYWERAGDEVTYDDSKFSGTGEYTGFLAFVEHPKVAVHLQHCDFGSSETAPLHMLLLDRTEHKLYALPVRLARRFLQLQWVDQDQESGAQVPEPESLLDVLNLETWKEVTLPGNISAQVAANMRRQGELVNQLVQWLGEQQAELAPDRKTEFEPHVTAMLLRHVTVGESGFAQAGELVHLQEVISTVSDQVIVSFYRDNGVDGPDTSQLFVVSGSWKEIAETLEVLLDLNDLDVLLASEDSLDPIFGRYADWHGQPFPIVPMLQTLAIRISLPCSKCHSNPVTLFMRSGLHNGAFCYAHDGKGTYKANLRDQNYTCDHCDQAKTRESGSEEEGEG